MPMISIVIAGRHLDVIDNLKATLEPLDDFRIVAICENNSDLVKAIEQLEPEIAIVDNCACNVAELQIVAAVAKSSTDLVLLTGASGLNELYALEATSICTLVPRDTTPELLVRYLRKIGVGHKRGERRFEDQISPPQEAAFAPITKNVDTVLTDRERDIVKLVSQGLSNKEIARLLYLSDGTVKVHLHNIYQKLEIGNRTLLAAITLTKE